MKTATISIKVLIAGLLTAGILTTVNMTTSLLLAISSPADVHAQSEKDLEVLVRASKARAAILRRVSNAVVHISVEKPTASSGIDPFDDPFFRRFFPPGTLPENNEPRFQRGLGSGFIVDRKGYVVTNNHVVVGAGSVEVKLKDGRQFKAKLVGADSATDLAVLKIDGPRLPSLKLGNSDALEVGETVMAIGSPFGLEQTITQGIVSAKGRTQLGQVDYEDFIQTDASINPGNSGGPLVNLHGEVVGVNTAIFSRSGGNLGVGFAIPINMVKQVMTALIADGKVSRGFLGVRIQDIDANLAKALKVEPRSGVLLSQVGAGSPAEKAGLRQGDIITHFDKKQIRTTGELRNRVAGWKPGSSVEVRVLRAGKQRYFKVKVGQLPTSLQSSNDSRPSRQRNRKTGPQANSLGFTVKEVTPSIAASLGYEGLNGVLVAKVSAGSIADKAGLREGALIRAVNNKGIRSIRQLERLLNSTVSGKPLLFLVHLGSQVHYLALIFP